MNIFSLRVPYKPKIKLAQPKILRSLLRLPPLFLTSLQVDRSGIAKVKLTRWSE